ncbi:MAG: methionine biosynthesis protein MetW, partial [Candidatus Omnitrophica bacterium]|nr:methionine biosynthesis protein MetW [Candidatus Omnitrophota bacterium]
MKFSIVRLDHRVIFDMVQPKSRVLDLGCGEGELLSLLAQGKEVKGQGIEIDEKAIYSCVKKGLSVFHGDIDSGLSEYPDSSFDYVILNQSLQQVQHFDKVLKDALRVGKKVIVGFPNFAYFKARLQLGFSGRAPVTKTLPYTWYESPNLHFFSIFDFLDYCRKNNTKIERAVYLGTK